MYALDKCIQQSNIQCTRMHYIHGQKVGYIDSFMNTYSEFRPCPSLLCQKAIGKKAKCLNYPELLSCSQQSNSIYVVTARESTDY
jgi:hypothetical protein